jgi:hypothetical protein
MRKDTMMKTIDGMSRRARRLACLALLLLGAIPAVAGKAATEGFLYGTVKTDSDRTYRGLLRWGTEEAFWDDLFNATKGDLPHLEKHGQDRPQRNRIQIFGITVGYRWDKVDVSRVFIARFGDIATIEVRGGEKTRVTMKDGSVLDLEGGSNDIGNSVTVRDEALGEVQLAWDRIERIEFEPTPAGVEPGVFRLFGTVETEAGPFEGFIQWDSQECLSTDKLDGEAVDGEMSIEMGKIAAIEKRGRKGSLVELRDGRTFVLEGTNDVDSSLRGIFVENGRYGRVEISWEAFERVEFRESPGSGQGYGDYKPAGRLKGTVTDHEGREHSGRLVFDLDEESGWELLNGNRDGIDYHIPFAMVRAIEPQGGKASKVVLRGGEELLLGESQDVAESNDGVLVLDGDRETYLSWGAVRKVTLD